VTGSCCRARCLSYSIGMQITATQRKIRVVKGGNASTVSGFLEGQFSFYHLLGGQWA
jgi:hypothetical protein